MNIESVLLIIAHPDDETAFGGILGRFKELDIPVHCLCVTRGEGSPTNFATGQLFELITRRPKELLESAARLGIKSVVQLNEPDEPFFLKGTVEFLKDADEFERRGVWNVPAIESEIEIFANRVQPSLVLTLLPEHPLTHPHHKLSARIAARLARTNRLGSRFRGLYASPEIAWYPEGSFAPHDDEIHFPLHFYSPVLECTYSEFQEHSARAHFSQVTGHKGELNCDEILIPVFVRNSIIDSDLRELSRLNSGGFSELNFYSTEVRT